MVVVTVFLSILNQIEFHLIQNRKENCHHDHIPFNVKENGNIVFSWCTKRRANRKPPRTSQHYRTEGFRGVLNWAPVMPIGTSLSDSHINFFYFSVRFPNCQYDLNIQFFDIPYQRNKDLVSLNKDLVIIEKDLDIFDKDLVILN